MPKMQLLVTNWDGITSDSEKTQMCRTPEVKAADEERLKAAQEAKEALAAAGLNWLAELQADMEEAQATTKKPKAVRLRPLPKKTQGAVSKQDKPALKKAGTGAVGDESSTIEQLDELMEDVNEDSSNNGKKKKNAQSLKTAIVEACKSLSGAALTHASDLNKKGNSLPAKSTLGGRVQNWKKNVYFEPTNSTSQSRSFTSASQVPPSTIFSKSQISHSSTSTSLSSDFCEPQLPASTGINIPELEDSDELVGGFGDEDLDDSLECAVVLATQGKVSTIKITSHDIDPDLVPPPLAQQCNSQVNSALKRKQIEDRIRDLSEEDNNDDTIEVPTSDKELMEVNEIEVEAMEKPIAVKTQKATTVKASHTTAATSVGTISHRNNKVPLERKPKQDGNWVELVTKACSTYLNTDLPPGCHEDSKWARVFVPTVFLWLSAQDKLWTITDANLLHACQEIFKGVYPNIQYKVVTSGSVFGVASSSSI
ncbi:hypothetical protein BDR07DRAFT_1496671 [Suillus spraguei]|nr:hypothetical protein BDR07DRAFT_1496671 [Suillus spraguei]